MAERAAANDAGPRLHRWTYEQFIHLWELGVLGKRRLELVDGRIIRMAPQKDVHTAACALVQRALNRCFSSDAFWVRPAFPLQIGRWSGPEPDVSVVPGHPNDYVGKGHPQTALLVVEVSDSSLKLDRGRKATVYATAGVADYWIVNLVARQLEVHRNPVADLKVAGRLRYEQVFILNAHASVTPLAASDCTVAVAELLPRIP